MALIARSLWGGDGEAVKAVVERAFGSLNEEGEGRAVALYTSDIRIEEGRLVELGPCAQGGVAIDRFTGGAFDRALFTGQSAHPKAAGGKLVLRAELVVRETTPKCEAGLLFLAFKDLLMGRAPTGGKAGVGRGSVKGGTLTVEAKGAGWTAGGNGWKCVVTRKGNSLEAGPEGLDMLEALVVAAQAWPPRTSSRCEGGLLRELSHDRRDGNPDGLEGSPGAALGADARSEASAAEDVWLRLLFDTSGT